MSRIAAPPVTTLGVINGNLVAHQFTYALQQANPFVRVRARPCIIAIQSLRAVRAYNSYRTVFPCVKRQYATFVFKQHRTLVGHFLCQGNLAGIAHNAYNRSRIDRRTVKQSERKLNPEHATHCLINALERYLSVFDLPLKRLIRRIDINVDTCQECHPRSLLTRSHRMVERHQALHRPPIRINISVESQLAPQYVGHVTARARHRHSVVSTVTTHHCHGRSLTYHPPERIEIEVVQIAFSTSDRSTIKASRRAPVGHEVLRHAGNTTALVAFDESNAHLGDEERVFTISFFDATPSQFACNVKHWRQHLPYANGRRLLARSGGHAFNQAWIERASLCQGMREQRASVLHYTLNAFRTSKHRYAQPGV